MPSALWFLAPDPGDSQDETDELEEMARSVLGGLSKKMQEEQEQIIRAVIEVRGS